LASPWPHVRLTLASSGVAKRDKIGPKPPQDAPRPPKTTPKSPKTPQTPPASRPRRPKGRQTLQKAAKRHQKGGQKVTLGEALGGQKASRDPRRLYAPNVSGRVRERHPRGRATPQKPKKTSPGATLAATQTKKTPQIHQKQPQSHPKHPRGSQKGPQRRPNDPTGRPKGAQRMPKGDFLEPKRPQMPPKVVPKAAQGRPRAPESAKGPILDDFCLLFGTQTMPTASKTLQKSLLSAVFVLESSQHNAENA